MHKLIDSLEQLSRDPRLSRTFSSSELCSLTLWILKIKKGSSLEYQLLYGWILTQSKTRKNPWSTRELFERKLEGFKFSMHRISCQQSGQTIFELVKQLCMDNTLEDACQRLRIPQPSKHKEFALAKTLKQVSELFSVRPTVFVKHGSNYGDRLKQLQPISSPNELAPAFVGSLVNLQKLEALCGTQNLQSLQGHELCKDYTSKLTEETGLDFCGVDSKRLGNLEWINLPSTDRNERPKVNIEFNLPNHTATVKVLEDNFPTGSHAIIRCRLFNGREISLDKVKELSLDEPDASASFTSQQKITKITTTIWVKKKDDEIGSIWYENSAILLDRLNLDVGVKGLTGTRPSEWLTDASNSHKVKQRVKQAERIEQIYHEPPRLLKKSDHSPWISKGEQNYEIASQLFSSPSKSCFIKNGWHSGELGRLTFLEWLKSITSGNDLGEVLIVDPYFDESGITELIVRATAAQAKYKVVTNTQVSKKGNSGEPERALRLRQVCQDVGVDQILSGLNFELLDLRSRGGGKTQLFHDRYILYYSRTGSVSGGYHLSNSIQGATKHHPLLITEISYDVLLEVEKYVKEKINDERYEVVKLFPLPKQHTLSKYKQDENTIERSNPLFSKAIHTKEDVIQLTHRLITFTSQDFFEAWIGLCDWLNKVDNDNEYRENVATSGGCQLSDRLLDFLDRSSKDESSVSELDNKAYQVALMLTSATNVEFVTAIDESRKLLLYQDWEIVSPSACGNGIRYATELLASIEPKKLIRKLDELYQKLLQVREENQTVCPLRFTISFVLQQVIIDTGNICSLDNAGESRLLTAMLGSEIPIIRAIAAHVAIRGITYEAELFRVFLALSILPEIEQLHVLAECSSTLRVGKSLIQNSDSHETKNEKQLKIFSRMRECYSSQLPYSDFLQIINRLSGRLEGSYSISITRDFLYPLIDGGAISFEWVVSYWLSITIKRLESLIDKKALNNSDFIFDYQCEEELIQVVSWSIIQSGQGEKCSQIDKLIKLRKKAQGVLDEPFSRTKNYVRWRRASTCLLWLMMLQAFLLKQSDDMGIENSIKLFQPSEHFDELLDKTFEEHSTHTKEWLWKAVSALVNPS